MKDYIKGFIFLAIIVALGVFLGTLGIRQSSKFGDAGTPNYYTSPTMATSSVGVYAPVKLMANSGTLGYASVCNTSPTSTNDLMLQFDATSTAKGLNVPGILVPGNSCYEINQLKLFTGNLYGIFTTNTSTVQVLYK